MTKHELEKKALAFLNAAGKHGADAFSIVQLAQLVAMEKGHKYHEINSPLGAKSYLKGLFIPRKVRKARTAPILTREQASHMEAIRGGLCDAT